jgi:hypothetical protein
LRIRFTTSVSRPDDMSGDVPGSRGRAGLPAFDSGTVYRTLRQLEKTGLV